MQFMQCVTEQHSKVACWRCHHTCSTKAALLSSWVTCCSSCVRSCAAASAAACASCQLDLASARRLRKSSTCRCADTAACSSAPCSLQQQRQQQQAALRVTVCACFMAARSLAYRAEALPAESGAMRTATGVKLLPCQLPTNTHSHM